MHLPADNLSAAPGGLMETVEPIRSLEKLEQIEDYLRRRSERDYMLFVTGCATGLRISDLRRLRVVDVRDKTHLVVRTKKTGKRVMILVTDHLAAAFRSYTNGKEDNDYLFASRKGWNQPLSRGAFYQILRQAAAACGVHRIGTHSMRKTFGWHFYQQTKDVAQLQELLGHQHPSVTLRYIGVVQDDLDQAMKRFSIHGRGRLSQQYASN